MPKIELSTILNFFLHPNFVGWFIYIKTGFILFSLTLLVLIILLLLRNGWFGLAYSTSLEEFLDFKSTEAKKFLKQWQGITKKLDSGKESEYKLSLMEAISFLDETLERMGYGGGSIEDRMKKAPDGALPNEQEILDVYRKSTAIIHNPDYILSRDEAKKILGDFEKIFKDLEMI
jgi:hypothetical protein